MNSVIMVEWITNTLVPHMEDHDLLLMDNLSSHHAKVVQATFTSLGIKHAYFPPRSSSQLSPLDNSLFHQLKDHFRSILHEDLTQMKQAVSQAWDMITARAIRHYFRHRGLTLSY